MRVFAGPNGSGKSTIIDGLRKIKVKGKPIDFGIYINADEIAEALRVNNFSFNTYSVATNSHQFKRIAVNSGLVGISGFNLTNFNSSFRFSGNHLILIKKKHDERMAQIIADFLRKKLLEERKKFSFETVFSHESKLDIMRKAVLAGYKVYLYFVSTETPEINKDRVKTRKLQGGHDVDSDTIERRYYRSLNLLYNASQMAYQSFFFDNSKDGKDSKMFAHFKNIKGTKIWDKIIPKDIPGWFITHYILKVSKKNER